MMNLVQLRERFVKLSGRYDLVVNTTLWADAGADFYINAGQKLLERLVEVPMNTGSFYAELAIGEYAVSWEYSTRAILEVWVETTLARHRAVNYSLARVKENYPELVSASDGSHSWGYAVADLRGIDVADKDALGEYLENVDPSIVTIAEARGIVIVPIPTTAVVVQVKGLFKQFVLTSNTDVNFWSEEEPDLLLRASLYVLDTFFHGNSSMRNWYQSIVTDAQKIDFDAVEEYSTEITQMEG